MKIRYLLKKKGKPASFQIYVALYDRDTTELISTSERIEKKTDWSKPDNQPKDQQSDLSLRIEKVKAKVLKCMKLLEAQDQPVTPFTVKEAYNKSKSETADSQRDKDRKAKEGNKTVTALVDYWLENEIFGYKPLTKRIVKSSLTCFREFITKKYGAIERKDLTPEIIKRYERYLQETKKLSNSSHGRFMKHLRWFLKSINYDVSGIKLRTHRKTIIALDLDELTLLEAVDVSANTEYQRAKDMFLLGCYTGQRISDLKRINPAMIVNNELHLRQQKTQNDVEIPLVKSALEILTRYEFKAPKILEKDLNKCIKLICKDAGINKVIETTKNVAGLNLTSQDPKYMHVQQHMSIKVFVSLAFQKWGLSPAEISVIVGKDLRTLLSHYLALPREEAKRKMLEADKAQMTVSKTA